MYSLFDIGSALFFAISLCALASNAIKNRSSQTDGKAPAPLMARNLDIQAPNVLNLTRRTGISRRGSYLRSLRRRREDNGTYGIALLTSALLDQVFLAEIKFGTESFQAAIDTGSSDTWLIGSGFQCFNVKSGAYEPQSKCFFGPTYNTSTTFEQIENQHFNLTYRGGESISGIVGREVVTFAGIIVEDQEVAVVNSAAWHGDGVSSGIIGLAFPALTRAYAGAGPTPDATQVVYNPLFTNMYSQGYTSPVFSLAIERSPEPSGGGQLVIGGVPPGFNQSTFASAPFQLRNITKAHDPAAAPQYHSYIITTKEFIYDGSNNTNSSQVQAIIDSGTTFILIPTGIANAVNALFDPPAIYNADRDIYIVNCSAKPPNFGVKIASETFFINSEDMILHAARGDCMSGINDAGNGMPILGDVFLKNVLAVFDIGASEMRFAAR